MKFANLTSVETLVESPFIILKIGNYTFGSATKSGTAQRLNVTYPNYLNSIQIEKVNGQINQYTITIVYAIQAGDDPNKFEKVFGTISDTRKITVSYGDWNSPSTIYKEEDAIITNLTSDVDIMSSRIVYTISAVGTPLALIQSVHDFPKREEQPSTVLNEIVRNKAYGVQEIFTGMTASNLSQHNLIKTNDQKVSIPARSGIGVLPYANYLVSCMIPSAIDTNQTILNSSYYALNIVADSKNIYNGPYFEVVQVPSRLNEKSLSSYNTYELDVGYADPYNPTKNLITNFRLDDNQSWSLLYKYSGSISTDNYIYRINENGNIITEFSPSISSRTVLKRTTPSSSQWWTRMTEYPIQATVTLKGLTKPAILMDYVKVNTYFYGNKHVSSGIYIITKQLDQIDQAGYRTTLTLQRLQGDE